MVEVQADSLVDGDDGEVNQLLLRQGNHVGYRKYPPSIVSVDRIKGPQLPWYDSTQPHALLEGTFDRLGE